MTLLPIVWSVRLGLDEDGVFEDYLGNHYFTEAIYIEGQQLTSY